MTREEIWSYCVKQHYSAAYAQYAMEHTVCEACHRDAVLPHHIRARGAGGDDDALTCSRCVLTAIVASTRSGCVDLAFSTPDCGTRCGGHWIGRKSRWANDAHVGTCVADTDLAYCVPVAAGRAAIFGRSTAGTQC